MLGIKKKKKKEKERKRKNQKPFPESHLEVQVFLSVSYLPPVPSAVVKNLPASAGDARDTGSIPGSGRYAGGGHGNPLQYSFLGNAMDRGAWGL